MKDFAVLQEKITSNKNMAAFKIFYKICRLISTKPVTQKILDGYSGLFKVVLHSVLNGLNHEDSAIK